MRKLIFVDAVRTPPQVIVQWNQAKSNALTTRYMASGIKRFKGETRIMEYEEIGEWCEILSK